LPFAGVTGAAAAAAGTVAGTVATATTAGTGTGSGAVTLVTGAAATALFVLLLQLALLLVVTFVFGAVLLLLTGLTAALYLSTMLVTLTFDGNPLEAVEAVAGTVLGVGMGTEAVGVSTTETSKPFSFVVSFAVSLVSFFENNPNSVFFGTAVVAEEELLLAFSFALTDEALDAETAAEVALDFQGEASIFDIALGAFPPAVMAVVFVATATDFCCSSADFRVFARSSAG
jgi:hypothetical protein